MKKTISILTVLVISLFLYMPASFADNNPGDPPEEPASGDVPIGGGAPIGGGSLILIGMAVAYGGRKLYQMKKEDLEE